MTHQILSFNFFSSSLRIKLLLKCLTAVLKSESILFYWATYIHNTSLYPVRHRSRKTYNSNGPYRSWHIYNGAFPLIVKNICMFKTSKSYFNEDIGVALDLPAYQKYQFLTHAQLPLMKSECIAQKHDQGPDILATRLQLQYFMLNNFTQIIRSAEEAKRINNQSIFMYIIPHNKIEKV